MKFKPSIRTGKKDDIKLTSNVVVGTRLAGLSEYFLKQLIDWDFHTQPSLRFTENSLKRDQRRTARLDQTDIKATVTQIT